MTTNPENSEEIQEEQSSGLTPEQEVLIWQVNSNSISIEQLKDKLIDGAINEEILFEHTIINIFAPPVIHMKHTANIYIT